MNIKGKQIEVILGEIRARHNGKDPFGVATDLRDLMSGIEPERQAELNCRLNELELESFWAEFIALARNMKKK